MAHFVHCNVTDGNQVTALLAETVGYDTQQESAVNNAMINAETEAR